MRINIKMMVLVILALLALLLAKKANAKTKIQDVPKVEIGQFVKVHGLVVDKKELDHDHWLLSVCDGRKRKHCVNVRMEKAQKNINPNPGDEVTITGRRIK